MYAICRRNRAELDACGDRFGIPKERRFTDYDAMLKEVLTIYATHPTLNLPPVH